MFYNVLLVLSCVHTCFRDRNIRTCHMLHHELSTPGRSPFREPMLGDALEGVGMARGSEPLNPIPACPLMSSVIAILCFMGKALSGNQLETS